MKFGVSILALGFVLTAGQGHDLQFTNHNELVRPTNYREWIYLSSGLGMTYGTRTAEATEPRFDNVFVKPEAYRAFLATGNWPDKTIFILEIRSSASHGSINNAGHFQGGLLSLEAEVKDESRFNQKWAYFDFGPSGQTAEPFKADSACNVCHGKNGAVDNTFVQFYPTLLDVASAKHTLKSGF